MAKNITIGIDVGTYATKVAISTQSDQGPFPKIIGTGECLTKGMRRGYIVEKEQVSKCIRKALMDAEKMAGVKGKRAYVSLGGVGLTSEVAVGAAVISKADGEVTGLDIKKAIDESEQHINLLNKKILHVIPLSYKLDGKEVLGKPEGMRGIKLEVRTLFVSCLEQHFEEMTNAVVEAGIDVLEVVAAPLAASALTLNDMQRTAGCILVDIGSETVEISVFENGTLTGLHVFAIGSSDITKDLALAFQIGLEEAEGVKIGSILGSYQKKKLDEVIHARLIDIFELIDNYLKKMKRSGLLPAGAIIIGGGAQASYVEEIAKQILSLPVRVGGGEILQASKNKFKDSTWFISYGLCFRDYEGGPRIREEGGEFFAGIKRTFGNIIKQLLP